jgi:serine/threonine protein kinase
MSNWVGQILGKVRIDTLLARGGTAEVYIGTHTTLQREVAIKILHNNYDEHPHALERFQREAMVVGKLRHPNIVQVFDFDTTEDSHPYLVMEYIKGPSLLKYLNSLHTKGKQIDFPHVVRLMNAMTSALQYAHDTGVIHRDIKPGNILLTSRSSDIILGRPLPDDFEPILTDFGLVRFIDSTQHTTGSGQIAGTPAYMSPEQARGDLTDGRTDIYSLGIVLYEMLAGHLPFEGETTMGVLMKHINVPPAPIPGLPPKMQYILDRALAKNVDDRFQSPAEFGQAFIAAVEHKDDYSTLEMLSERPLTKPAKRLFGSSKNRQRWIGPAIAAVMIVALGASFFLRNAFSPPPITGIPAGTITGSSLSPAATFTSANIQTATPVIVLGRTAVLHFENGSALVDQATLVADALLSPPTGYQFEVWLVNKNQRISLGILNIDPTGKGRLTFAQAQGANLIALYTTVEITIEPNPDPNTRSSGVIAYSFTLPPDGLTHVRYLLASFPNSPDSTPLIQGLYTNVNLINDLAQEMGDASESGDNERVLQIAEAIHNIIVGDQNPEHKDLNNDGQVADPSDGYGLLLNGRNLGYLPAVYSEAEAAVKSTDATEPMKSQGEVVMASVQNLAQWSPELQTLTTVILNSPSDADTRQQVANIMALAEEMLNGNDINQDSNIDPAAGEGGARSVHDLAYRMADMPLEAVGILNLGTGTPAFMSVPSTSSGGGGGGNTQPTKKAPPGQERTKKPNNSNNSNKSN